MVVLVLTACPAGLRGHLTRWLLEVSPGVFIGEITARVRERMWLRVLELAKDGRAIMVYSADSEQGLSYRVHRHDWEPVDFDGVWLMRRPEEVDATPAMRPGWSSVGRMRRARRGR
ncbi:type I-E CRISPR-associated endoribonuclease Cas2e [Nocardioides acrostichi]|uniref:Type I-E CRISPR-associated endoribonuclease Cas2 n=1 Tax=Nocardioides acrostichi TaxID=2784339 RepID=A0A930UY54_9ACTN|nr:type I-E CRISPR-associated endoribonuclease Cas2e [Nocardioides acrostichi]MBF4163033.1 type I-E CRISPR-associated endoribonuclease Cas2 [Nocardioides acrostichi]